MTLAGRIANLREDKGMSLETLAEAMEVPSTIYLNGNRARRRRVGASS